jgi:dihydrofolate synthase/folylpolyglutamate synthase
MTSSECRNYLGHLQHFGIKLGLENIATLCAALGDPQNRFPSIHVAGTNGKGSVSAMLAGIMKEHGFRTGLYTSPHLARVEERIRVDGAAISPRRFQGLLERLKATIDGLMAEAELAYHPTYFEVLTALAFLEFAERNVDVAVLEVGLGGRFDATNIVRPLVSVITTIAKDHEKHLGSSLEEIAFEKAGIIKSGVPVVCGVRRGVALREIRRVARERGAPLIEVFGPGRTLEARYARGGYRFLCAGERGPYAFSLALAGRHQGHNAAVAIATAEVLSRTWRPLGKAKIVKAVRETRWEGRLETVCRRPLVLLDGAHNAEGAASLAAHIRETIGRPVVLVFAAMQDKDIHSMTRLLFPLCSTIILTCVPYERSATPEELAQAAPRFNGRVILEPDTRKAVELALALSGKGMGTRTKGTCPRSERSPSPVVIAGSLFLIGEVKRLRLFRD